MPTIKQLRYFMAVVDLLNFRRAAEACHVSQPTLSMQIRELEERLGVQLLERTRSRVLVTPAGREIAKHAREALRNVKDIVDLAEQGRRIFAGTHRVGILPSLGPYLMPHILPSLREHYPDLRLYLREDIAHNLANRLEGGELDFAFLPLPVHRQEVEVIELFDEPLWLAVPRKHRLAERAHLKGGDLRGEVVLTLENGQSLHAKVMELCDRHGAHPHLDFAATSLDTLRQMTAMGMGVTFLPALYVRAEALDDQEIAVLPFKSQWPFRRIGLVWRRKTARRRQYLVLAKLIRKVLAAQVPEVDVFF